MKRKLFWMLVIALALALSACGGGPSGGPGGNENVEPAATEPPDDSSEANTNEETPPEEGPQLAAELSVYNWPDYIDEQILADYEAEYGVKIIYDTFASNEDLLAKLQAGATGYDLVFPSDYMVSQMIELGLLAEIDVNQLSNWGNIDPDFKNAPFDPGNKHCVPYQWGTTGIAYRAGHPFFEENPPDSWAYLFEPEMLEQYSEGGVNVLDDQRELLAAALAYLGHDMNSTDRAQLEEARDLILAAKPYWETFNSSDYDSSLLVPDEVVLSHSWSGDAAEAYWDTYSDETEDGNWYYAIPKEGAVKWLDNICITSFSERKETALHFMNYLLDAEVGAAITNFTFFASPNEAARAFITEEILNNPGIFPPEDVKAKLTWLVELGDAVFIYDEMWTAIKG
ncbi:MAG: spermidine/putrescine ABC transporter substrate-binding protein [Chloroflexi bacterium]|nr:spermidine/putrescine ABC transporter substrate-binding protein [Chloroflexota bacterium]MCI0647115.1 spermidine/putrescine ABC transporter substrate-binding protein [Chloroflexota bacterium]MCI0726245.1 spermidine/putrescine ABC transporter substrate-binding protein [Chloroflexota bacterium]